ncbi:dipeptidyl aminopeptidase/acylaminoacyl peptidase [Leeuwenhoekiella polynyae]|uniref:Dipeptidyl aminopeptidase/acylaminoacyl peptidase n=2 Tax=Leeuwenhoekiella polynyae TaxID=1550906 RepID=A0A4Q0P358_9FLAO|nr:dipeptidyl aminopeptidase/acylaminoacyl peptidase [Leeuwenhoekiella polynyae]
MVISLVRTFVFGLVLTMQVVVLAQAQTDSILSPAYYDTWETIQNLKLKAEGDYVAFVTLTRTPKSRLYLINTRSREQMQFDAGMVYDFIPGTNWFTYVNGTDRYFLNLQTKRQLQFSGVRQYRYDDEREQLLLYGADQSLELIRMRDEEVLFRQEQVKQLVSPEDGKQVFFVKTTATEDQIMFYDLRSETLKVLYTAPKGQLDKLVLDGTALVWVEQQETHPELHVLPNFKTGDKMHVLKLEDRNFPKGSQFVTRRTGDLVVRGECAAILFKVQIPKVQTEADTLYKSGIEQWNSSDPELYPRMRGVYDMVNLPREYVWWYTEDRLVELSSETCPVIALSDDLETALGYDRYRYKTLTSNHGPIDLYQIDPYTGTRNLVLEGFPFALNSTLNLAPDGKAVAYFSRKNWWFYDFETGKQVSITGGLNTAFYDMHYDAGGEAPPAGRLYWDVSGEYIYLRDNYDLYAFKRSDTSLIRITRGAEKDIRFEIDRSSMEDRNPENLSSPFTPQKVDLDDGIVLKGVNQNTYAEQLTYLKGNFKVKEILKEPARIRLPEVVSNGKMAVFKQETSNTSPALYVKRAGQEATRIFETNPELTGHYNPRTTLIDYTGIGDQDLKAVLYYPLNYDPHKQYPMVVHLYERQSQYLHRYFRPDDLIGLKGFNPFELLREGYFVLMPDLNFIPGKVRESVTIGINNAVDAALKKAPVDASNIGIYGYSFGGYEAALLATQSHRFKTYIAGGAPLDTYIKYFSVAWNLNEANYYFLENHQIREAGTFFERKQSYMNNSALYLSDQISSPMLLFSGKEDGQVNWTDGLSLYLSLRRQEKPAIFLVYEGENHAFMKPENNRDISDRILDWFDYHLKGIQDSPWIELEY